MIPFPFQTGQAGRARTRLVANDPYFANVSLLLHMEGTNGGTTFTDSSSNAVSLTANGNVQLATAPKFGTLAAQYDGSADAIEAAANATLFDIGTVDATIEFWYNSRLAPGSGNFHSFFAQCTATATTTIPYWAFLFTDGSSVTRLYWRNNAGAELVTPVVQSLTIGTYYHFAFVEETVSGTTTFRVYRDGVQITSGTTNSITNNVQPFFIGSLNRTTHTCNAFIDDFRFTKGVSRYPGGTTFTPPTAAFPNS